MKFSLISSILMIHQLSALITETIVHPHSEEVVSTHSVTIGSDGEIGTIKNHFRKGSQVGIEREHEPFSALQTELEVTTSEKLHTQGKTVTIIVVSSVCAGVLIVGIVGFVFVRNRKKKKAEENKSNLDDFYSQSSKNPQSEGDWDSEHDPILAGNKTSPAKPDEEKKKKRKKERANAVEENQTFGKEKSSRTFNSNMTGVTAKTLQHSESIITLPDKNTERVVDVAIGAQFGLELNILSASDLPDSGFGSGNGKPNCFVEVCIIDGNPARMDSNKRLEKRIGTIEKTSEKRNTTRPRFNQRLNFETTYQKHAYILFKLYHAEGNQDQFFGEASMPLTDALRTSDTMELSIVPPAKGNSSIKVDLKNAKLLVEQRVKKMGRLEFKVERARKLPKIRANGTSINAYINLRLSRVDFVAQKSYIPQGEKQHTVKELNTKPVSNENAVWNETLIFEVTPKDISQLFVIGIVYDKDGRKDNPIGWFSENLDSFVNRTDPTRSWRLKKIPGYENIDIKSSYVWITAKFL